MAINQPDWNAVRAAAAEGGETLFRRVEQTVTEFDEASGEETTRKVLSYQPIKKDAGAAASFARIEADVERLIQEVSSYQQVERDLRSALDADSGPGAQFQRR